MFFHGNSVWIHRRCSSRNKERSPSKSVVVMIGTFCGENCPSAAMVKDSRRGAGRDNCVAMVWRFSGVPWTAMDLTRVMM